MRSLAADRLALRGRAIGRLAWRGRTAIRLALRVRAALVLASCACDTPGHAMVSAPPVDFTIAGIALHVSSGAVVSSSGKFAFYLSDQPEACRALALVPVGRATTFSLHLVPPSNGSARVTVVPPPTVPAAGQATGGLARAIGGKPDASVDASDGTISWSTNSDGSVLLNAIDVGFAGTADRLISSGLALAPCK